MTTQADLVLDHIRSKGSITRIEAMHLYRIAHLPTRIFELKACGINIRTERRKDHTGRPYARYHLN